jgi:colanic acid/amylovoran biosynthesis protein
MNVLITNSVPLNGGDEALLRALILQLRQSLPHAHFTVLTSATGLARTVLPDLSFDDDLEHAIPDGARGFVDGLAGPVGSAVRQLAAAYLRRGLDRASGLAASRRVRALYDSADLILPAPGGYLHDHYPLAARLDGISLALALGKPVLVLGHSIGPFWKPESVRHAREVLDQVTCIVVRERFSLDHLRRCGIRNPNVRIAPDIAFALGSAVPELFRLHSGPARRIGVCFRRWPLRDEASALHTRAKAAELCTWLLRDPAVELVFTSTCQGVPQYVDDSRTADGVLKLIPDRLRPRCTIDREHRSVHGTIRFLSSLDACISMRMHVCVMAMLGGTPALALDYEQKSVGLYEMMDLDDYHVDFRTDLASWRICAERFFADCATMGPQLQDRVAAMTAGAINAIDDAVRSSCGVTA